MQTWPYILIIQELLDRVKALVKLSERLIRDEIEAIELLGGEMRIVTSTENPYLILSGKSNDMTGLLYPLY